MTRLEGIELLEFNVPTEQTKRIYVITAGLLASLDTINKAGGVGSELDSPALARTTPADAMERTVTVDRHRVCGWLTNLRVVNPNLDSDPEQEQSRTVLLADFETTGAFGHQLDEHLQAGRELFFAARTLCWVSAADNRYYVNRFVTADAQPIPPLPRE